MRLSLNRPLLLLACTGIALYVFISVLSAVLHQEDYSESNPAITKDEAASAAKAFIQERFGASEADAFVMYQSHKTRSGYLQKENLADAYKKQFEPKYPIDYFLVELRDRKTQQTYTVEVNFRDKSILGWSRKLTVAEEQQKTDREQGEIIARAVMRERGLDSGEFRLLTEKDQPSYRYLFESAKQQIGASRLRVQVEVVGGKAVGYTTLFSIPEEYQAWLDRQDKSASVMTWISLGGMFIMAVAAVIYSVLFRKHVPFSRGVLLTLIYLILYCANNFNMYPGLKAVQGTEATYYSVMATLLIVNFVTVLMGAGLYFSLVAGSELWRRSGWEPWVRWRDASFGGEVFAAMGRGYLLCLFTLGVQRVLFYAAEHGFHVWAVSDPSDSPYNMFSPALFPLMAWVAGISEEATFRLFGIAWFRKLVRVRFLAVLIPSVMWAASHTQYPIYPVYTRLVEVTVLGIIFGYAFLRYGFMTAVFAHASMDSILMGLDLVSMNDTGEMLLGYFYMLLPGLIGLVLALLHRTIRRPPQRAAN